MKLVHAHRDVFPKASLGRKKSIKFFMFSDDAESSAFTFDELLDKIDIMRFTLNTFDAK